MDLISRRTWMHRAGAVFAWAAAPKSLFAQAAPGPLPAATAEQRTTMATMAQEFMDKFKVPGLSVAIGHRGQMLYEQGFGYADTKKGEEVTPDHLFRIASVSKPITSVAIFTLVERGQLRLEDHVFGPDGLLHFGNAESLSDRVKAIKIYHLLNHTGGGWDNKANDPMFAQALMDHAKLIEWTLRTRPLENEPGKNYSYSNFGYCVLGRVIEKITGRPYDAWVKENILKPCGITTMELGGNRLADRKPREVLYYDDNPGRPYGMNVTRMDSHGGWLATARDLVHFAERVDGFDAPTDILQAETLRQMTLGSAANPGYACGWSVNAVPNWWHLGSLPGTFSIMVRTARGFCWSGLVNTRTEGLGPALDQLMWKLAQAVPAWGA
ncbi:MAG TPA: serine hydrolase domain-containing protein [Lacunisphaera sp.]|nr:serine hydrolase domain-containing protein [Lacunisphaera sp.]